MIHTKERRLIWREVLSFVAEKSKELKGAATCSQEAREVAQVWLNALGTEWEAQETKKYIAELEEDIVTAEELLAFAESEAGHRVFAAEASNVAAHARDLVVKGVKYCDCSACAAVEAILKKKEQLLG